MAQSHPGHDRYRDMSGGRPVPSVTRGDVAAVMRDHPEYDAWQVMVDLEQEGYNVWTVCTRDDANPMAHFRGNSAPERIIGRWMTSIRLKGEA